MKFSQMKIECPVCQSRIREVKRNDAHYWTECPNQCARIRYTLRGEMNSYVLNVHIEDKDYRFGSHRDNNKEHSTLNIYRLNSQTEKWEFREIMLLHKYTDFEEVANNPRRFVQRLLNVKAFA